jgi:hypothetical protein
MDNFIKYINKKNFGCKRMVPKMGACAEIFAGEELSLHLRENDLKIEKFILSGKDEKFFKIDKKKFIDLLVNKFSITIPQIDLDNIIPEISQKTVPNGVNQNTFLPINRTQDIIVYNIPYKGDKELLKYKPIGFQGGMPEIDVKERYISFEVNKTTKEEIESKIEPYISTLKANYGLFTNQIEEYNTNLRNKIDKIYDKYKKKISDDNELLESLKHDLNKSTHKNTKF